MSEVYGGQKLCECCGDVITADRRMCGACFADKFAGAYTTLTAELAEAREQRDSLREECERLRGAEKDAARFSALADALVKNDMTFGNVLLAVIEGKPESADQIRQAIDAAVKAALSASGREGAAPAIASAPAVKESLTTAPAVPVGGGFPKFPQKHTWPCEFITDDRLPCSCGAGKTRWEGSR